MSISWIKPLRRFDWLPLNSAYRAFVVNFRRFWPVVRVGGLVNYYLGLLELCTVKSEPCLLWSITGYTGGPNFSFLGNGVFDERGELPAKLFPSSVYVYDGFRRLAGNLGQAWGRHSRCGNNTLTSEKERVFYELFLLIKGRTCFRTRKNRRTLRIFLATILNRIFAKLYRCLTRHSGNPKNIFYKQKIHGILL